MFLDDMQRAIQRHDEALIESVVTILERNLPLCVFGTMPADEVLRERIRQLRARIHGTEPVNWAAV